ncbi:MAG: uracil-DNA glycosylase [Hyphomicrobiaceae bacterium]
MPPEPRPDCALCPRLVAYRASNRAAEPGWYNGAVPSFGSVTARLLIVGLAPGVTGANRTGRPFTGDHAGILLYTTLLRHGFATGTYGAAPDDGLSLVDCLITNAVRCVPPANKPTPVEVRTCGGFLAARIASLDSLAIVLALGRVAHDATLSALGLKRSHHAFAHGARHTLPGGLVLADSYHCSRYNTNTGVLTEAMFDAVFAAIRQDLNADRAGV